MIGLKKKIGDEFIYTSRSMKDVVVTFWRK